jgi:hypothetical protein
MLRWNRNSRIRCCVAAQDLKQRWQLHAVEPLPNTSERGPDKEDPIKFRCATPTNTYDGPCQPSALLV